jgi:hypothetical protein
MPLYNQAYVYMDGQLLAENTTVSTRMERTSTDIFSITGNYEGQDVGPFVRIIEATNVFPVAGSDINYEKLMFDNTMVEMMITDGGSVRSEGGNVPGTVITQGRVISVTRSAGVGQNYSISFTFKGSASAFE